VGKDQVFATPILSTRQGICSFNTHMTPALLADLGQMYATNAESPYELGQQVADLAAQVLNGQPVEKNKKLEGGLVTKATVKKYAQHLVTIGDVADAPPSLR